MKLSSILLFCFISISLFGQSTSDLENRLEVTKGLKEKMELKYDLARAYKSTNATKASKYAKEAFEIAAKLKDERMKADIAYLDANIFIKLKQPGKAKNRYEAALRYAKRISDTDLAANSAEMISKIALQGKDTRKIYEINKELLSLIRSGGTPSETKTSNTSIKLQNENKQLQRKLDDARDELMKLKGNKTSEGSLADREKALEADREKVLDEISSRDERLKILEQEKIKEEERRKRYERKYRKLSKEDILQEAMLKEKETELAQLQLQQEKTSNLNKLFGLISLFVLALAGLFYSRFRSTKKARKVLEDKNKIIEEEQKRSDELLLNILPANIAEELKTKGKVKAQKFNSTSVLFTDFKNFTRMSELLTPEELVADIDHCFKAFDYIVSQYPSIEKIKTIGDAYMCASGLSKKASTPMDLVKAAIEMQEFLEEYKKDKISKGKPYFEARIGIHSGSVVAGVVGFNKFVYDIWGDTVNIAARMEAQCEPGKINVSESTYNQIRYKFDCTYRGKIEAKNKGQIDMYYVNHFLSA